MWTDCFFHDKEGKIFGEISFLANKYKATLENQFLGWYISEQFAKKAVEEAYVKTKQKLNN